MWIVEGGLYYIKRGLITLFAVNSSTTCPNCLEFLQWFLMGAEQVIGYSNQRRGVVVVNGGGLKFLCIYCICALVCVNRDVGVHCSTVTVCERDRMGIACEKEKEKW